MGETYPYEELDGRRFQRLAQSLITAERPRTQCFTISGPDGGRDAVDLEFDDDDSFSDSIIFQVKFREQNPLGTPTQDDLYKWVVKNLKSEIPKLELLKKKHAREFIFVTNIPASGHLDTGLRDRVQAWAKEHLPLPSFFWWREDVDARLDRQPPLVFKFMLFRGPDSVQAYLTKTLGQNGAFSTPSRVEYETRNPAISTILLYLSRQYEEESSLRFKQAHVDAPLLDSFVDVPLSLNSAEAVGLSDSGEQSKYSRIQTRMHHLAEELWETEEPPGEGYITFLENLGEDLDEYPLGAASALLNDHEVAELDRLVIEAGPGQGKSTLIQFLGQVHRARMLNKGNDLTRLPRHLSRGPLRLPLRVELRHLGKWLQGLSPWAGAEGTRTSAGAPTLHSYIADHVRHVTGGMRFSNDDLVAIVTNTPTILLLDGLDEVADLSLRGQVVKAVGSFIQDMESLGAKLQVIATGRPSSLASAPSFQRGNFLYMKLDDLTVDLTERYSNAWIGRRSMPADQASELRRVLAGCLTQPHVAELARTPMQLAILLWLVHTRGWNLPDKRTALYDEYINTLLDREADKTPPVRKHREELLAIHGHLGWLLHARSQEKSGNHGAGDIEITELKRTVWEYLEAKEGPSDCINEIIEGIRRLFVLVDPIQDKFEFQVQPLREFFAGRHLYKTAPYQTNAVEVTGSRPERLEALIRDPHWMNVARFFCGWYDVGELADLTQRLSDLWEDSGHRFSLHSRLLVAYLLSDYVSAAAPRNTRRIAKNLTDLLSMRQILAAQHTGLYQSSSAKELVPVDSGLSVLTDAAKQHYVQAVGDAVVYELVHLLLQIPATERSQWWLENLPAKGDARDEWVRRGVIANCLLEVPRSDLQPLFDEPSNTLQWVRCVESGRMDVATSGERMQSFIDALARGYAPLHQSGSAVGDYLTYLTRNTLRTALYDPRFPAGKDATEVPTLQIDVDSAARQELDKITDLMIRCRTNSREITRSGLRVRADLIGKVLDEPWAAWRLALFVAPWTVAQRAWNISDEMIPLSKRATALWCHRDDPSYWREQFGASVRDGHKMAVASAFIAWAPGSVIAELSGELDQLCSRLMPWELFVIRRFAAVFNKPGRYRMPAETIIQRGALNARSANIPICLLAVLEVRMETNAILDLGPVANEFPACSRHAAFTSGFAVRRAFAGITSGRNWENSLEVIRAEYSNARGDTLRTREITREGRENLRNWMSANAAHAILTNPSEFPIELIESAEDKLQMLNPARRLTLYDVAKERNWFDQD